MRILIVITRIRVYNKYEVRIMSSNYFDIKNIVTKSNQLIESSHKLTLQQQKIICAVASKVRLSDTELTEYVFHMKELAELLELNKKGYYAELRKVIRSLQSQVFTINKIVDGQVKSVDINWFYRAEYNQTKNTVSLKFAEDLKPFLLHLKDNFTSYSLENIIKLKSSYSLKLYEILKSKVFKKGKTFEITLEELNGLFLNPYAKYNDFKRNILEKCKVELKEKTDISFEYEEIKTGRKVTSIKLFINDNKAKNKAIEELCATKVGKSTNKGETYSTDDIKAVQVICYLHSIKKQEANSILKDSKGDMEMIKQCYKYTLNKNVPNIVGYMRTLVRGFNEPQINVKKGSFNNYEQRKYDFNQLEKDLLSKDNDDKVTEENNTSWEEQLVEVRE